ncbi:hypothetical protein COUCH_16685 [Couchioplanes caeruleus]|uniref:hypothetical protein n=1 Tax=Couchioplanes caeruleus TaxID=56438 RepID=UPI0020BF51F7|nr:hypothetical protein [Couchioplanes caeruleus]UQU67807.1 hypothetical protein COUCH_16685 [Couchioplanes caeruleus]
MRTGWKIAVVAAVAVLFWAGLAVQLSRPGDYRAYHRTVLQVAQGAHDAAQTAKLTAQLRAGHRTTAAFTGAAFDDAAKALAGVQKQFAGQAPPDERAAGLRDRLGPLLARETAALGDVMRATDDAALRSGARALDDLARQLDDFITAEG